MARAEAETFDTCRKLLASGCVAVGAARAGCITEAGRQGSRPGRRARESAYSLIKLPFFRRNLHKKKKKEKKKKKQ